MDLNIFVVHKWEHAGRPTVSSGGAKGRAGKGFLEFLFCIFGKNLYLHSFLLSHLCVDLSSVFFDLFQLTVNTVA